jgi:hypothetical protein
MPVAPSFQKYLTTSGLDAEAQSRDGVYLVAAARPRCAARWLLAEDNLNQFGRRLVETSRISNRLQLSLGARTSTGMEFGPKHWNARAGPWIPKSSFIGTPAFFRFLWIGCLSAPERRGR